MGVNSDSRAAILMRFLIVAVVGLAAAKVLRRAVFWEEIDKRRDVSKEAKDKQ